MKIDLKVKQNEENKDTAVMMRPGDENVLQPQPAEDISGSVQAFSEMMAALNPSFVSEDKISSISEFDYKYDTISMSEKDARFFIKLAQNGEFIVMGDQSGFQLVKTEATQTGLAAKAVETTNMLADLISKAQKTQKPVRIAFDNDVSVVLKIDKHGKVSAEFIPGSLEAENYLRTNLASLRQKFDEQNLPYNDIFYRDGSKRGKQNKRGNKGE